MRHVLEYLFAIPTVVSAREHVNSRLQQLLCEPRRDAEARRRVLPVRDDQINLPLRNDVREAFMNDMPSGRADNVSDE